MINAWFAAMNLLIFDLKNLRQLAVCGLKKKRVRQLKTQIRNERNQPLSSKHCVCLVHRKVLLILANSGPLKAEHNTYSNAFICYEAINFRQLVACGLNKRSVKDLTKQWKE